jgi:two-component system chemotaxis response regulator CheB
MISAYADDRQIDLSFRAIAAGALEVVAKPASGNATELRQWARYVCDTIVLMAEVPIITRSRRARTTLTEPRIDIVGIVASTGGPLALAKMLAALPPELPVPILVAQHIAEGFTEGMVRWLGKTTKLGVEVASDGRVAVAGRVYFPPDGHDLEVTAQPTCCCRRSRSSTAGAHSASCSPAWVKTAPWGYARCAMPAGSRSRSRKRAAWCSACRRPR